jgi:hypothetical protein
MALLRSLIFTLLFFLSAEAASPSAFVSEAVWQQVKEYIMPNDHPAKSKLDKIFSHSRAFSNFDTMEAAGFAYAKPQHHTHIIVTRHPKLKGYVIKAYLDMQKYHLGQPEHFFWVKRVIGSRLIRDSIQAHQYGHLLKVPKKWIYLLPDKPSPPSAYLRKMFILVEEDMDIYNDVKNEQMWGSPSATKELLRALFTVITEHGFFDCAKPANCPFSKDGRVALVDTQTYYKKRVKYSKLTPFLSPAGRIYWKKLIEKNKKATKG